MKFISMELENYRQFFGLQRLEFAASREKNVTIIFGANGSGKTTLLSAFTWCLYGQMPPGLESPDKLINERALGEAVDDMPLCARVSIEFIHEDLTYVVERTQVVRKHNGSRIVDRDGGPRDVTVSVKHPTGETEASLNPNDKIQQILPVELHRSFFFDGERIEKLVKPTSSKEINAAIKKILGLELIERAILHLRTAEKQLRKEHTQALPSGIQHEVEQIEKQIDLRNDSLNALQADLDLERNNYRALSDDLEAVVDALRRNEQSRALQQERDTLLARIQSIRDQELVVKDRQKNAICRNGFLAFTRPLTHRVASRVDEVRERGQIPTPIKRQFVEDLLARAECICGTPLKPGTDYFRHVEEWRLRAVAAGAEEAWVRLGAQAKQFDFDRDSLYATLHDCVGERAALAREHQEHVVRLSEIQSLLGGADSEEIQDLEDRHATLQRNLSSTDQKLGGIQRDIDRLGREMRDLEKARDQKTALHGHARAAAERASGAREALEFFEKLLEIKTDDTRRNLDAKIKEVYGRISYKDYVPELTESFELELYKVVHGNELPVAKSTGENQILSLSFVGAISHYARQLSEESKSPTLNTFAGGTFPIVMDSPFGALDESYRAQIAEAIPQLGDQVIVLVSKSQGLGVVLEKLRSRLSRRFVIDYKTPKLDSRAEAIDLDGQLFPYVTPSETVSEWAQLREV